MIVDTFIYVLNTTMLQDFTFSGLSHTLFGKLELSGTFEKDTTVFPQSVFTNLQLEPQLEKVLPDGRITLNLEDGSDNVPLISMSLLGRTFGQDGPPPEQWCPHEDPTKQRCLDKRCSKRRH